MYKILIIEDKKSMADMLTKVFKAEGFNVKTALNLTDGLSKITSDLSAVITDLKLPDGDGMDILKFVKRTSPFIPVIVMTAYGSIEIAVKAVKEGAYDFITKPFDPDHLLLIIKRAIEERAIEKENLLLKREFQDFLKMPVIIGISNKWIDVMEKVKKVAPLKTTILITGESGTGKELLARAIHYLGPRAEYPFVTVNCAAIPKDLIESEIFGYEKGAFTGAGELKLGKFELADKGTIFLDEIGDMDIALQSKLLRAIQEKEFERVGGTRTIKVDIRIIAATNKDLQKEVSAGRFREDLFYRLNVFPINIPPLRERREDILPLARYFIAQFCKEFNKPVLSLSSQAEAVLLNHEWKGNVRELRNVIERAVILCDSAIIYPEHLNICSNAQESLLDQSLHEVGLSAAMMAEKAKIEEVLRLTKGNKLKTAEILKVSYKTLLNKIKEYGITL